MRKASSRTTSELFRVGVLPVENTTISAYRLRTLQGVNSRIDRTSMGGSSRLAANYRLGGNVIRTSPHRLPERPSPRAASRIID
jgi:hypothetical protein